MAEHASVRHVTLIADLATTPGNWPFVLCLENDFIYSWNGTAFVEFPNLIGVTAEIAAAIEGIEGGAAVWGDVTGTLGDQADLQAALDAKSAASHNHDADYEPIDPAIQSHIGSVHAPANATANDTDANLKARGNHTGEQAQSTITNLVSDLAGKSATSHNHTGTYEPANANIQAHVASAHAPIPAYARVTGSNATTTGQSLVNITGLTLALLANSVYEFEAVLMVASSSTAGNGYGVNYSAAGAVVESQITGTLAAATQKTLRISALNTAATPFVTVAANGGILIKGIMTTGANPGNLTVSHLKVTSGTSTAFINSFLKVSKI